MVYIVVYPFPTYDKPGYYISSISPEIECWDKFEANAIFVPVHKPKIAEVEAHIARNVLLAAGASVIIE